MILYTIFHLLLYLATLSTRYPYPHRGGITFVVINPCITHPPSVVSSELCDEVSISSGAQVDKETLQHGVVSLPPPSSIYFYHL